MTKKFRFKFKATFAAISVLVHVLVMFSLIAIAAMYSEVRPLIFTTSLWVAILGSFVTSISAAMTIRAAEKHSINKHYIPERDPEYKGGLAVDVSKTQVGMETDKGE